MRSCFDFSLWVKVKVHGKIAREFLALWGSWCLCNFVNKSISHLQVEPTNTTTSNTNENSHTSDSNENEAATNITEDRRMDGPLRTVPPGPGLYHNVQGTLTIAVQEVGEEPLIDLNVEGRVTRLYDMLVALKAIEWRK